MACPHEQEGIEPVRTFFGQGEEGGQFFAILCSFMDGHLPKKLSL